MARLNDSPGVPQQKNLGVNLQESKQIVNRLQDAVVKQQLRKHCEHHRMVRYVIPVCPTIKLLTYPGYCADSCNFIH
jgi:hypothetical protein